MERKKDNSHTFTFVACTLYVICILFSTSYMTHHRNNVLRNPHTRSTLQTLKESLKKSLIVCGRLNN